ncbi:hypothetical protein B484DRAFT_404834 [Ochromonadaceae sp. CCMP2298]|nr:hypothetical protein B484DRAFT_404834 [Ochromonadaceae sp. CCMP2298]
MDIVCRSCHCSRERARMQAGLAVACAMAMQQSLAQKKARAADANALTFPQAVALFEKPKVNGKAAEMFFEDLIPGARTELYAYDNLPDLVTAIRTTGIASNKLPTFANGASVLEHLFTTQETQYCTPNKALVIGLHRKRLTK